MVSEAQVQATALFLTAESAEYTVSITALDARAQQSHRSGSACEEKPSFRVGPVPGSVLGPDSVTP